MAESEENETMMMCWEDLKDSLGKEPHIELENEGEKPVENTQKPKDEEEHVKPTPNTGNRLKTQTKNLVGKQKTTDPHLTHKKQNNHN